MCGPEFSCHILQLIFCLNAESTCSESGREQKSGIGIVATRAAARLMIGRLGVARGDGRKAAERRRNAKSHRRSFEWENFCANGPRAFSGGQPRRGC